MKLIVATVLLCGVALVAQQSVSSEQIAKAAEGARQLTADQREPDSFSLTRVWIAHSEKHGDSICYSYRGRNGFGGVGFGAASYVPNKKGEYVLSPASDSWGGATGNINDPWPGGLTWFRHCSDQAMRKETSTDITAELKKVLGSPVAASTPKQ